MSVKAFVANYTAGEGKDKTYGDLFDTLSKFSEERSYRYSPHRGHKATDGDLADAAKLGGSAGNFNLQEVNEAIDAKTDKPLGSIGDMTINEVYTYLRD